MPILFQFFTVTDLAKLDEDKLAALNHAITMAIENPTIPPPVEVQDRAKIVFQQLRPNRVLRPVEPEASAPLLNQLIHDDDLQDLSVTERQLLNMAVKYMAIYGYQSMGIIKGLMEDKFVQLVNTAAADPSDSPMSPFNPENNGTYPGPQ